MKNIAVLIPCYNEEAGIADVIKSFQISLPEARIFVYDNNSHDLTVQRAKEAGAIVRSEPRQGKGNVVRRMFADIDADMYLMVDGDVSYDASAAPRLIQKLIDDELDMVVGVRVPQTETAHRPGHAWGNKIFNTTLRWLFGGDLRDIFSGYRVFSKRFVKSLPAQSGGFDIETEMSIFALQMRLPIVEVDTSFFDRAAGSESKLSTFRDGFRILLRMLTLLKDNKPLFLFGSITAFLWIIGIILGTPVLMTYLDTHTVPRLPTALITVSLGIVGMLSLACGLILDSLSRVRSELLRLRYLSIPW